MWLQCGWVGGRELEGEDKGRERRMSSFHPAASARTCSAEA